MRERPILFSAPMVRAILEGRKTMTRRIAKTVKHPDFGCEIAPSELVLEPANVIERTSPYGRPGDQLWLRETFRPIASGEVRNGYGEVRYGYAYKADSAVRWNEQTTIIHGATGQPDAGPKQFQRRPWKSSIHMPRRASRITLEVTGVRVERLQDIDQAQAMAEGIDAEALFRAQGYAPLAFERLWESINGAGSWDANPHVWVIEFKRVTP